MKSSGETTLTECSQATVDVMRKLHSSVLDQTPTPNGQTAQTWINHQAGLRAGLRALIMPAFAHEWLPIALKNPKKNAGWLAHPEALEHVRINHWLTMPQMIELLQLDKNDFKDVTSDDPICGASQDMVFGRILILAAMRADVVFASIGEDHCTQFHEALSYLLCADKNFYYLFPAARHVNHHYSAYYEIDGLRNATRTGWKITLVRNSSSEIINGDILPRLVIKNVANKPA